MTLDIAQYVTSADIRREVDRSLAPAPPADWSLPLDHFSASSFDMWNRCKYQWQQRYIHGRRERPAEAPVMGTAVHAALERNLGQKIETHVDLDLVDLVAWYMDEGFARVCYDEQEKAGEEIVWDTGPEATRQRGKYIVASYHDTVAPRLQPTGVERSFSIDMGLPLPVHGRIDAELATESIDWKTGKQKTTKPKESWRLQGGIYRVACGNPVGFHSLSASPKTNAVTIVTPLESEALLVNPTDVELAQMQRVMAQMADEMNRCMQLYGPDEPWPTNGKFHTWACEFCGFRDSCPAWRT